MHHPFTATKPEHEKWFYSDKKEDLERLLGINCNGRGTSCTDLFARILRDVLAS